MSSQERNDQLQLADESAEKTEKEEASIASTSNGVAQESVESQLTTADTERNDTPASEENKSNSSTRGHSRFEKATNLQCPFTWQQDLNINSFRDHDLDLLYSSEEMFEDSVFRFRSFIVSLVLCYHNFYRRNIEGCIKYLEDLERMMKNSSRRECNDVLFNSINDALYHVIHSCRIYILETTEQKYKAEQVLNKMKSFDTLDNSNKAGIWAIRANVYVEYGYEGVKNAVFYIGKAVNLDPENAFWHFMKGIFMGRLRRMDGGLILPTNEEFEALRIAIDKREDPAFIAFTGETYMETTRTAKKLLLRKLKNTDKFTEKQLSDKLEALNDVAAKYFKRSIELKPNSSHLLFRCGKGLIHLPPPYRDVETGLDYIRKGLKIAPDSSFGNHAMAMYLEKIEKKPELAKKYLDVSVKKNNFPAHIDMIRISYSETRDSEILWNELEKMLDHYTELPKRRKILGEIVCYHLFVVKDLVEACFYMKKLMTLNSKAVDVINNHKSMILPFKDPVPLSDLILNQIQVELKDPQLSDLAREVYKKYLRFLIEEDIQSSRIPDATFVKLSQKVEENHANKETRRVDERARNAQKRVHAVHEFEADPCHDADLKYLDVYKNDLQHLNSKNTGVGDDRFELLNRIQESALPRRARRDDDSGERRREARGDVEVRRDQKEDVRRRERTDEYDERRTRGGKAYKSSRRDRSYSSSRSSVTNSDSDAYRRKSRRRRGRSRSYSSTDSRSGSDSRSSYDDDRRKSRRQRRRRSDSSSLPRSETKYEHRRAGGGGRKRRESSSDVADRRTRSGKDEGRRKRRSSSRSASSGSSSTDRSVSTQRSRGRMKRRDDDEKRVTEDERRSKAENSKHGSDRVPKTDVADTSVERVRVELSAVAIDAESKPSGGNSAEPFVSVDETRASEQRSGSLRPEGGSASSQKRSKERAERDRSPDSERSGRSVSSRASGRRRRPSPKRRSRDRSADSVRTTSSRASKQQHRRRRRSRSASTGRSSDRSRSDDRRSVRDSKNKAKRRSPSVEKSARGERAESSRSERRSSREQDDRRKRAGKERRRRRSDESSDRGDDSAGSRGRRSISADRKVSRPTAQSKRETDRRRKEAEDTDHSSKSVSSHRSHR